MTQNRTLPMLALVGVTAVWGFTFVQVQNALALYPLFAFLAVRFAISTVVLAPFAWGQVRAMPRSGVIAGVGAGALLAAAYGFQTAGLELTTVSSTGFITGLYVVFTPFIALGLFGTRVPRVVWIGVACAVVGLAAPERRARRLGVRERARPGERARRSPADRRDGAIRAALRPACSRPFFR